MSKQKPWSEIVRKAADERIARMTDCEESLVNRIREREQQLADRDAAWEQAIRDELMELLTPSNAWKIVDGIKARIDAVQKEQR